MNDSSETDSDGIKLYPEVQPKKVKRYNTGLYKNYKTNYRDKQCFRTISKWDTLGQRQHITAEKVNDETELQHNSTYDNQSTAKNGEIVESQNSCNYDGVNHMQLEYSEHDCSNLENISDICDEINHSFDDDQNLNSNSDENEISDSDCISSNNHDTDDGCYDNDSDDNSENTCNDNEAFDDIIMFETSQLTVRDVMTLIMAFSLRFKLSDIGREYLIDMIKLLAGPA
ncbi:uncharacterized protein [Temnothorax nylanderi]|uniref:uncharacterized protein n=1 Tax=Temnothorax nylanderi TaxID=102681 RepID=UPI003A84F75F